MTDFEPAPQKPDACACDESLPLSRRCGRRPVGWIGVGWTELVCPEAKAAWDATVTYDAVHLKAVRDASRLFGTSYMHACELVTFDGPERNTENGDHFRQWLLRLAPSLLEDERKHDELKRAAMPFKGDPK